MTTPGRRSIDSRQWRRLRRVILERDHHVCHWCHGPANTVDHVIPRVEGGSDDPANLVAACGSCNSRRSLEWIRARRRRASSSSTSTGALAKGSSRREGIR